MHEARVHGHWLEFGGQSFVVGDLVLDAVVDVTEEVVLRAHHHLILVHVLGVRFCILLMLLVQFVVCGRRRGSHDLVLVA